MALKSAVSRSLLKQVKSFSPAAFTAGFKQHVPSHQSVLPTAQQEFDDIPAVFPRITHLRNEKKVEIMMPGYSYGDMDRKGYVNPWKIALHSEGSRTVTWTADFGKYFAPPLVNDIMTKFRHHKMLIMSGAAKYSVKPGMYNQAHYHNPVKVYYTLAHLGNTSFQVHVETYSTVTGELLHEEHVFYVNVNMETRSTFPFPQDFREWLTEISNGVNDKPEKPLTFLPKPAETKQRNYTCHYSHTDYYSHTNASQYVKFAYDAACEMVAAGELEHFKKDLARYRLVDMELGYKGETRPKDELCIHGWEPDPGVIALQVEKKKSGKPVFLASFKYD